VWTEIFLANREVLRANLEAFRQALADLERAIVMGSGDALRATLERIKAAREGLR
jgi:prephenate dehydrogenase